MFHSYFQLRLFLLLSFSYFGRSKTSDLIVCDLGRGRKGKEDKWMFI